MLKNLIFFLCIFQISSTCPVCVTYETRSKFVITSLRPAFAKIYPSTRPDLAVETFFHARPGSPLLRGITDDDFITWFDKTELASLKTNANIDNICECGRICSRDYEFRKANDTKNDETTNPDNTKHTEAVSSTTEAITSTAQQRTTTEASSTETATTIANDIVTEEITTSQSTFDVNVTEIQTSHADKPIIIPTATYVNTSRKENVENNILPLISKSTGDLIIQKLPKIPKPSLFKKEDIKKKPLPRRKGTLKATYGDKQEKFFTKSKLANVTKLITNEPTSKPMVAETDVPILHKVILTKTKDVFIVKPNFGNSDKHVMAENTITKEEVSAKPVQDSDKLNSKIIHPFIEDITKTTTSPAVIYSETLLVPHTITAITNSNIKTMHNRTMKPKTKTQIKKPIINTKYNLTTSVAKNETTNEEQINSTKMKTVSPEKYFAKTLKSINKEIHKIPPTPISETSKTLAGVPKSDIAPENRGGFEILDKNSLWELLKEGPDAETSKLEDKLQVHNRLNTLAQNVSNVTQQVSTLPQDASNVNHDVTNDNRSL